MADESEFVTLVSNDGYEFAILREAACLSDPIRHMIDPKSQWQEGRTNRCTFSDIDGSTLDIVCLYLYHHHKHRNSDNPPDLVFPPAMALDLLMAAHYLMSESWVVNVPLSASRGQLLLTLTALV